MATGSNETTVARRQRRREATIDEVLGHAVDVMTESGVGGLTVSELARRTGVQPPSLYKYFPSLHAIYDVLFARGVAATRAVVADALAGRPEGVTSLRIGTTALVRWAVENPALAQLLFWRPVPGFSPSPAAFEGSIDQMAATRAQLAAAVRRGELVPEADSEEALRLYTVVISGLISQQLANEPGTPFERGAFTRLTDEALDLFFRRYAA